MSNCINTCLVPWEIFEHSAFRHCVQTPSSGPSKYQCMKKICVIPIVLSRGLSDCKGWLTPSLISCIETKSGFLATRPYLFSSIRDNPFPDKCHLLCHLIKYLASFIANNRTQIRLLQKEQSDQGS